MQQPFSKVVFLAVTSTGTTKRSVRKAGQSGRGAPTGRVWSVANVDLLKRQPSDAYANRVKLGYHRV